MHNNVHEFDKGKVKYNVLYIYIYMYIFYVNLIKFNPKIVLMHVILIQKNFSR